MIIMKTCCLVVCVIGSVSGFYESVIDGNPGLEEHLGCCEALERVHLQKCQLRDRNGVGALFWVCRNAREIVLQDCWGLDNGTLSLAVICR